MSKIWYMRDNHTFLRLCNEVECAIKQVAQEWDESPGTKYGMICSKDEDAPEPVHVRDDFGQCEAALIDYYDRFPFDDERVS